MNTKLKYIVGMFLGALFTIPLASSALSVFTVPQGGTASSSLTGILKGNGKNAIQTATPGTDYVVPGALASYLSLSSWYATTTDGLDEGLTNKYFSDSLVDTWFSTKPLGMFWSTTSADHWYTLQSNGIGTIATSSAETANEVPFYTSTNGYPALLGTDMTFTFDSALQLLSVTNLTASNAVRASSILDLTGVSGMDLDAGTVNLYTPTGGYISIVDSGTGYRTSLSASTLTGNWVVNLPDADGTLALLSDISGATASSTLLADFNLFSGDNTFTGNNIISYLTGTRSTTTNATTTNLSISGGLSFGGVVGTTWSSFCTSITGSADLCDGSDATGGAASWPFTTGLTNFGVAVQATSTPLWFTGTSGIYASGTSRFGTTTIKTLNGVLYADQFLGSDIGAKINNAYANCPATGCTIVVPSGAYTFSTKIAFETNAKPVRLECSAGAKMTWSGTGTSTVFNTGTDFSSRRGLFGCHLYGPDVGPGGTTVGVQIGGTNGEPGVTIEGNYIIGFGKGIVTTKNVWDINVKNNRIQFNDRNIEVYSADNSGENFVFTGNNISDCNTVTKCVYFRTNGSVTSSWFGNVFDDAQLYFEDGNANTNITGGGFENPNEGAIGRYTYIVIADGGYSNMTITGTQFSNGASTLANSPYQFISNGGNLKLDNVTVQSFSSVESPVFVGNYGGGFYSGQVFEIGTALTDISTTTSVGLVQLQNGRVGYATTTPLDEFGIKGNVGIYSANGLNIYNDDNTAYTTISRDDSKVHATWPWGFDDGATYGSGYTNVLPPTGGLLVEGKTGIGTTTPWAKLSIGNDTQGNFPLFSVASSTSNYFTISSNGNIGIGTTTPWGRLSIVDTAYDRQPGIVMATSTTDYPFWGTTASTSDALGDPVRMLVGWGTRFLTNFDTFAQLSVNGEINTHNTIALKCEGEGMKKNVQKITDTSGSVLSVTTGTACGDFSYIEDNGATFDYVAGATGNYIRLRTGATAATTAAGDGAGIALTTAGLTTATNTPLKLEVSARPVTNVATSTLYVIGFTNTTGVNPNYAVMPTDGCGFVASTTQANWRIFCGKASAYTYVDSGIASTTKITTPANGAFTRFRVEMGKTYATFRYLRGSAGDVNSWVTIGSISTNYPNTALLNPTAFVASIPIKSSDELQVRFIRAWYNDPEPY